MLHGALQCLVTPLHQPLRPHPFRDHGHGVGAAILILVSLMHGGFAPVSTFDASQWLAIAYLGVFGGGVTFYLWAFALGQTAPTRVAISVTINPITASLVGTLLLHEPLSWNLVIGLAAVFAGISIATTTAHDPESSPIFG